LELQETTVKDELFEIQRMNGGLLDPAQVVSYARDPETALHGKFQWDDSKAAEEYRIWQARQVIRMELVVIRQGPSGKVSLIADFDDRMDTDKRVRAFVSLPVDRRGDNRGYRDIASVLEDTALRENLLREAKNEMQLFRRKYGMLERLAKVFSAMDELL